MRGKRGASGNPPHPAGGGRQKGGTNPTGGDGSGSAPVDPIDFLLEAHSAQLQLCDRLEAIADSLPGNVDQQACRRAAMALRHDVHLHHLDEEEGLFPLLRRHAAHDGSLMEMIRRLEAEHASDEGFSDELIELLERLSRGERPHDQEAAGYMLRGFFESFRRHLAFENQVILPRAAGLLTAAERNDLMEIIRRNRIAAPRPLFPGTPDEPSQH